MKLTVFRFIAWLLDLLRVENHNWHRKAGAVQAGRTRRLNRSKGPAILAGGIEQ